MNKLLERELKNWGFFGNYNSVVFEEYKEILLLWNEKMNLTAITEEEDLYIKHFLDSLTLFSLDIFKDKASVIDIGSGAGFPGIPLKLYNESLDITLMDSLNKRITFLNEVIEKLNLVEIRAIHGRAEELGRTEEYREQFDICTSRAVASLNTLSEYSLPFVKIGGYFVAMKGSTYREEVSESKNAIGILGGQIVETREILLPGDILHSLIVIEKIKTTPKKYPRSGGKPKKNPL